MKKEHGNGREADQIDIDEILPEYEFTRARRNKYASRFAAGSVVVVLEPNHGDSPYNSKMALQGGNAMMQ